MSNSAKEVSHRARRTGQKEDWKRKGNSVHREHVGRANGGTVLAALHMVSRDRTQSCECAVSVTLLVSVLHGQQHRCTRQSPKTMAAAVAGAE